MKPQYILILVAYIVAIGGMAWYSRQKAVDFARQEQRRQQELGTGYTPTGPRLNAMSGIFNPDGDSDPEAQAKGLAITASQLLMEQLATRLQGAMAEDGPVGAVNVCGDVAQEMTTEFSRMQGIQVRRVALRHRNARNAPDAFERAWLENAENSTSEDPVDAYGELIPASASVAGEYRHLSPIYLKPLCVTCHGTPEQIPAEVQAVLAERYPNDTATGFEIGDLRGAVSVRIPFASAGGGEGSE